MISGRAASRLDGVERAAGSAAVGDDVWGSEDDGIGASSE